MDRPCHCGKAIEGVAFVRGTHCGRCWLWVNGKWGTTGGPAAARPAAAKTVARCSRLALETVSIPGSARRDWRECGGGYGSTTPDARAGHVCGCSTPGAGVWRAGFECGAECPGFTTGAGARTPTEAK